MTEPARRDDDDVERDDVERGAQEEYSDAPLTEMEREVSRPPEERWADSRGSSPRRQDD
jgi:hypothetical protein